LLRGNWVLLEVAIIIWHSELRRASALFVIAHS
jgi:hypothetical protein